MTSRFAAALCAAPFAIIVAVVAAAAPRDPGPRGAPINAGRPIAHLTLDQLRFFNDGLERFTETEGVDDGLGPSFNGNSCAMCHSQPAIGGTSPSLSVFPNVGPNPQVALANDHGATNNLPFFVTSDGPIREAHFKFAMKGGQVDRNDPDGSVHDLFTIQGRDDAPGCVMAQEDFALAQAQDNLSLRIPTPLFGGGLIEAIDEGTIVQNMKASQTEKRTLGIAGRPNYNENDATISRFGWKAQNKSLILFSHEAYSVELGETNQMFPNKRGFYPDPPPASCLYNALPEDATRMLPVGGDPVSVPSDDDQFATFMRLLDQPMPACVAAMCSTSIRNGRKLFTDVVQCALCHTPSMTTGGSVFTLQRPGLSNVQANLFSDLLIHHMGQGLNDGITQGKAGPDEFRTAPLWGLGQRAFFLHDGRTNDLLQAIQQHASQGSEANQVISSFNQLSDAQKQDLLNFLRSL